MDLEGLVSETPKPGLFVKCLLQRGREIATAEGF